MLVHTLYMLTTGIRHPVPLPASTSSLTLDSASNQTVTMEDTVYDLQIEDPTARGLVGYWKFDEGQGTTAVDSSGNGNDGTLIDAPKWTTTVTSTITFDNPYSLDFGEENDDYVMRGAGTYTTVGDDLTLSLWFNHKNSGATRGIFHYGLTSVTAGNWAVALYNTDVRFYDWPDGGSQATQTLTYSADLTSDAEPWHNLVITRVSATGAIIGYIDGVEFDRTTGQTGSLDDAQATKQMGIGRAGPASYRFLGQMDDVRLYNRVLSEWEVVNLAKGQYADGASL